MALTYSEEPGACPTCGVEMGPVFMDWRDPESETGTSGGVMWRCVPCSEPKFSTDWGQNVRRMRVMLQVNLRDMGAAVGISSSELSDVETGHALCGNAMKETIESYFQEQHGMILPDAYRKSRHDRIIDEVRRDEIKASLKFVP